VAGVAYVAAKGLQADFGDPETIFILLSQTLFHPLVSGFLLAAILAAIMSTISSQLLVSSSSLTEDFYKAFVRRSAGEGERLVVGRMSVLGVALVALVLASDRSSNILTLVSNAWAGFGAAFGPVILFSLYWPRTTRNGALSGVLVGALTVLVWLYAPFKIGDESLSGVIYEMIPGFALGSLATVIVSLVDRPPPSQVASTFRLMHQAVRAEDRSFL
jgi:Na+/proline symporter